MNDGRFANLPKEAINSIQQQYVEVLEENTLIRAAEISHEVMDANVRNHLSEFRKALPNHKIACTKGCSFCCYIHVAITQEEAELLLSRYEDKIDFNLLSVQAEHNGYKSWSKMKYSNRKCTFLTSEGHCGVYKDRPLSCRSHHVLDSNVNCDSENLPGAHVKMLTAGAPEVIKLGIELASPATGMANQILRRKALTR